MADEIKNPNDKGKEGEGKKETITKEEHDKILAENVALKEKAEKAEAEVYTDEYLAFLEDKEKKEKEPPKKEDMKSEADLENMSKTELVSYIQKTVKEGLATKEDIKELKDKLAEKIGEEDEKVLDEVKEFAGSHPDFDKLKPIMHGLSLQNRNWKVDKLYSEAKKLALDVAEVPEEFKEKSRRAATEKPGGGSSKSVEREDLDEKEAAKEAFEELSEEQQRALGG